MSFVQGLLLIVAFVALWAILAAGNAALLSRAFGWEWNGALYTACLVLALLEIGLFSAAWRWKSRK